MNAKETMQQQPPTKKSMFLPFLSFKFQIRLYGHASVYTVFTPTSYGFVSDLLPSQKVV